jgi:uncharacterized membrane protein
MNEHNRLARIEAYSDGVFAIAATLLILEIRVPELEESASVRDLWHALAVLWPSYLAFALSFGTILIVWVNHHKALRLLRGASSAFLYANGLLLLMVTFLPFPTAVLARYINTDLAPAAVVFYACTSVLMNLTFLIWFWSMQRPVYLIKAELSKERIKKIWMQIGLGTLGYIIAAIIGWRWPKIGLALIVGLFVLWTIMSIEDRNGA